MKRLLLISFVFVLLSGCEDAVQDLKKGFVQLSIPAAESGRIGETPNPAYVLVSMEDNEGNLVEENKKIPLYSFGNGWISEGLQLIIGDYSLTSFLVLDNDNNVIYATPSEGSPYAGLVNDPLPIDFVVTENGSTLVTPQVIEVTEESTPENFGYVSFGIDIVEIPEDFSYTFTLSPGESLDSAYLILKNEDQIINTPFELISGSYKAIVQNLDAGSWNYEVRIFNEATQYATWYNNAVWYNPAGPKQVSRFKGQISLTVSGEKLLPPSSNKNLWKDYHYNSLGTHLGPANIFFATNLWGTFLEVELPVNLELTYIYVDRILYSTLNDGSDHHSLGVTNWSYCNNNYICSSGLLESNYYTFEMQQIATPGTIGCADSFIFFGYTYQNQDYQLQSEMVLCVED